MRNLSCPASLTCLFFCTISMIFMASMGGFGMNCSAITFSAASIFKIPSGFAVNLSRCVSTSACAGGGNLPKRSINSSRIESMESLDSQFANRLYNDKRSCTSPQ